MKVHLDCIPCFIKQSLEAARMTTDAYRTHYDIAKQYHIIGIPNLTFFRYGKKITSITGVRSIGDIKDTIDDLLKKL